MTRSAGVERCVGSGSRKEQRHHLSVANAKRIGGCPCTHLLPGDGRNGRTSADPFCALLRSVGKDGGINRANLSATRFARMS